MARPRFLLGIDIGTNSVGSAGIDKGTHEIRYGVCIFSAGVEEKSKKRGEPKNHGRREHRSQRRQIERRSRRKRILRRVLMNSGLLPHDPKELEVLFRLDPWQLRRKGLSKPLTPYEMGRVLVHLNQRRGAVLRPAPSHDGAEETKSSKSRKTSKEEGDEGKIRTAVRAARSLLDGRTFGQFMADQLEERICEVEGEKYGRGKSDPVRYSEPVRNRGEDNYEFCADREMIRDEFNRLWRAQSERDTALASLLTDDLKRKLDDPSGDGDWACRGVLFGQRQTKWKIGTLGRCDLEPTERCLPVADRHAQEFRVLQAVNNLRLRGPGDVHAKPLSEEQRVAVMEVLMNQGTGTLNAVRKALKIDGRNLRKKDIPEDAYELTLEADEDQSIPTNWFYREIALGVFGADGWGAMDEEQRESVNRAVLKFAPDNPAHREKVLAGARRWWGLSREAAEQFMKAWSSRPKVEKRISFSRRALLNLLPWIRQGYSVSEARDAFASSKAASSLQRKRYAMDGIAPLNRRAKHYLQKHAEEILPPAPELSNPVVRKAIHEVRRQVIAQIRHFGRVPDHIVIELARSAKQSGKVRNEQLSANRRRERVRKEIREGFGLESLSESQRKKAEDRVILAVHQKEVCPYSGQKITPEMAAQGDGLEIDHIVPRSRSYDDSLLNKVLCFRAANRNKGSDTPREWMTDEGFEQLQQRMAHLKAGAGTSYFTPKQSKQKWKNLTREAPLASDEEFRNSQLTDTAYAAKQVLAYLRSAFAQAGLQCDISATKGRYTAMLRRDWGLVESELDHDLTGAEADPHGEKGVARKEKDRRDHRHHALDALAIAFCTGSLRNKIANQAARSEEYRAKHGRWPRRERIEPPWGTAESFRRDAVSAVRDLVVCHRPERRRLVGGLHDEKPLGPVLLSNGDIHRQLFSRRESLSNLKCRHLRVPEGWDALSAQLEDPGLSKTTKKAIRKRLSALVDPAPGQDGLVRDRTLRDHLRKTLRKHGLDPDAFNDKHLKKLLETEGVMRNASGVPIKRVVLLRKLGNPVFIARAEPDGRKTPLPEEGSDEPMPSTVRIYNSDSNSHIEIREDLKTGQWYGDVVRTIDGARRIRTSKGKAPGLAVDRSDRNNARFVMSLSIGETIHARRPKRQGDGGIGYYVVVRIRGDNGRIFFAPHWDARPAKEQERDRWSVSARQLRDCGVEEGTPPVKVRVSPLGAIRPVRD